MDCDARIAELEGQVAEVAKNTGALEVTASQAPDSQRTVLAIGRMCANARYQAVGATHWYDERVSLRTCEFKPDLAGVTLASIDYWFYSNNTLTGATWRA